MKEKILEKMEKEQLPALAIAAFERSYNLLLEGADGKIPESEILPVEALPDAELLEDFSGAGSTALPKAVMIKLNGGLGTSMGLDKAKSLLPAKQDLSFLDIIGSQVTFLREKYSSNLPLIFMNSFRTEADTLEALKRNSKLIDAQKDISFSFLQNKVPKILASDFSPAESQSNPKLEWCPPGHGDIYTALLQSGILTDLLDSGFKYAFISNSDNLGASLDLNILGYFAKSKAPMLMEVATRTAADKKGGHLAAAKASGQLLLREVAQCPSDDLEQFQNISKHSYFNTNSLWFDLEAVKSVLDENNGVLPLPIIVNKKNLDPRDLTSPEIIQLETAMGAALSVFEGARAIRVPRSRFIPIKKTTDLLTLWSDIYELKDSGELLKTTPSTEAAANVELDERYFKTVDDFCARFAKGAPSLKNCQSLTVKGDVYFGSDVIIKGEVVVEAKEGEQLKISDKTTLAS